ncbi:MAG: peptide deformylase [Coriobacteriales bacterium]|nr:peptide deformylase [Coriobacteriales bacterium]
MQRNVVRSRVLLSRPSVPASPDDASVGQDLLDTLEANKTRCVGLAANMIGVLKRIIVVSDGGKPLLMYNPEILQCAGEFQAEEGCLSLDGMRPATRYRKIRVRYQNERFEERTQKFSGWTAQIIQHEIDHCNGIVI